MTMQHYTVDGYDVAAPDAECWCVNLETGHLLGRFESYQQGDTAGERSGALYDLVSDTRDLKRLPENILRALCQEVDIDPKTRNIDDVAASLMAALEKERFRKPSQVIKQKEHTMTESTSGARNGNVARAHKICDEQHKKHGNALTRKMAVEAMRAEGIPPGTASSQWQRWRTANGYDAPKAQKEGAAA